RIGAGIDDDGTILLARPLNAVDQGALVVGLGELDGEPQALRLAAAGLFHVGQGLAAVDRRLPLAQHVEIGPVQHQHRLLGRRTTGGLRGQSCLLEKVARPYSLRASARANRRSERVLKAWRSSALRARHSRAS